MCKSHAIYRTNDSLIYLVYVTFVIISILVYTSHIYNITIRILVRYSVLLNYKVSMECNEQSLGNYTLV